MNAIQGSILVSAEPLRKDLCKYAHLSKYSEGDDNRFN